MSHSPQYVPADHVLERLDTLQNHTVDIVRIMARGPRLISPDDAVAISEDLASLLSTLHGLYRLCRDSSVVDLDGPPRPPFIP